MSNNSESALIQQSIEVAADDIAAEEPGRWSWWVIYLLVTLKAKVPAMSYQGFLQQLQWEIAKHLREM